MHNSYKKSIGIAKIIWEKISGGVIIAATKKTNTIIYLLLCLSVSEETNLNFVNKIIASGIWNASPKARINFKIKDKYSLTLGSNSTFNPWSDICVLNSFPA